MKRLKGKKGFMTLKLDMSKAYDRVEWDFLRKVLIFMNFPTRLIEVIMKCVTSVSYGILINGTPTPWFLPERGLRQGDPLSPYLFILCVEAFSGLYVEQMKQKTLHGVVVARGAPEISHLFFADDSLIFSRATLEEAEVVCKVIKEYEQASGQLVNLDKSEVNFSQNVSENRKNMIRDRMGVKAVEVQEKYLGLPTIIGRSKKQIFAKVEDRMWKKLKGWKEQALSKAGKEVLLKSVAQAIPSYIMSCFRIPVGSCQRMEAMCAKFWWGQRGTERKIHWNKWHDLCRPKEHGGLGFRNLEDFNTSLLAKQVWRLTHNEKRLLYRVWKARYFPKSSLLEAGIGHNSSYAWQSIWGVKQEVEWGLKWVVGDGNSIRVWQDPWLP